MVTRRINFGFLVCFLIAVFVGQTLSQTRGYRRTRERSASRRLENMNRKALERHKQQLEQLEKQRGFGKSEKELMEQVLRATEEQWKAIKPKLDKVRSLKNRADVSIRMMGVGVMSGGSGIGGSSVGVKKGFGRGSMSGSSSNVVLGEGETVQKGDSTDGSTSRSPMSWTWVRPSRHRGFENLNEGEKICEELFQLLEDDKSESEEIRQKMEALRKFRQEAKEALATAQKELCQLVTPRQEAALIMMGLLD